MNFKRKLATISASIMLLAPTFTTTIATPIASAATFTSSELNTIRSFQNRYASLDQTPYSKSNLYTITPNLTEPFSAGQISQNYIDSQLAWINYYRALFGLPSVTASKTENQNAQIAAAVMAAIGANPFQNQHGLPNESKPSYISESDWDTAVDLTKNSNLNFNILNQSAGDVITDFLTDRNNLTGGDTGHRAWILSPWLYTTGIGAAYGANGYRYSVQRVINLSDVMKTAAKSTITYPSEGVFPIELLSGQNIYCSFYLANEQIKSTPTITVTDLDTGQKVTATDVHNYSSSFYGNFSTNITYKPGNISLISGHQYQVNINGIYSYSFKLFNQVAANQPSLNTTTTKSSTNVQNQVEQIANNQSSTPAEKDVKIKSALLLKAEEISDTLMKDRITNTAIFGRSYQDGKNFYNLGKNQWFRDFYRVSNPLISAGILDSDDNMLDKQIYTSPYANLQTKTYAYLKPQTSYAYGQSIIIGGITWYYLGPNQWVQKIPSKNPA
ncbi:hypothetical protein HMPREF0525_00980 [Lactobacillus jensenii 27-2-CHN]|nr:hypothetical protein HMPREF0525_00980 [Lactobacillus jensenii 27-2-CHN]